MEKAKRIRRELYNVSYYTVVATTVVTLVSAFIPDVKMSCIIVVMEQLWLLAYLCSLFGRFVDRWTLLNFITKVVGLSVGAAICRIILTKVDLASITGYTQYELNVVLGITHGASTFAVVIMMYTMWIRWSKEFLIDKKKGAGFIEI